MRFSTLALLIALPAAAYAAVCPQQFSVEPEYDCAEKGESCYGRTCCGDLQCVWVGWRVGVCPSASALPLADRNVSTVNKGATSAFCLNER